MDSNPGVSHLPTLFACESASKYDGGYVNDNTEILNLRKLMLSPQENDYYNELPSSCPEHDYEYLDDYEHV